MPDKKKVFIVGGTGRIGTLIIDNLFKNYKDDYEVIGVQSRGIKEAPKILKEANIKIYSNLDHALANADIIIDASSPESTQNNIEYILANTDLIKNRKNKGLLYFAITPNKSKTKDTTDILNKNKNLLSILEQSNFVFKRTDKINNISDFLNTHKSNIDKVLANGGKVVLTDIHRTEKESFSQVLLNFLVDNKYISNEKRRELENKESKRRKDDKNNYKPIDSELYNLSENGSLQLFSYRSTPNSDFQYRDKNGKTMVGSTHIVEFFDKDGKELYFNENNEPTTYDKAYIDCFYTDNDIAKSLINKAFKEYENLKNYREKSQQQNKRIN